MFRIKVALLFLCACHASAQNLARTGTATVSSAYSNLIAARAIDGDPTTNWAAPRTATQAQPEWLLIDLGRVQSIERVELLSYDNPTYGADYFIDYNFYAGPTTQFGASAATGRLCDTSSGPCVFRRIVNLNGAQVRYLKFEVVGGTHWAHLYEIEAYASAAACTYSVSPSSSTHAAAGGTASYQVTAPPGCAWNVTGAPDWISFNGASSGAGSGTVRFTVSPNTGPARSASLLTGGQSHTISQEGVCAYGISPDSHTFPASGGSGVINVATAAGCAWSAAGGDSWINIGAGRTGSGDAFVTYAVSANTATAERRGSVAIAGKTHTVVQAGMPNLPLPEITPGCVVNQADLSQAFAPGIPVRICGRNFAPRAEAASGSLLPTSILGVSVEISFAGVTYAAPVFRVADNEVVAQLPFEVTGDAGLRIRTSAGVSQTVPIAAAAKAPRLFTSAGTGSGAVLATNSEGEVITAERPARPGENITVLATGLGQTTPPARTGSAGDGTQVVDGVTARLNGEGVRVSSARLSASLPAVYELAITVPGSVVTGHYKLTVAVAGDVSQSSATLPAGDKEALLGIRENADACTRTDRAPFRLDGEAFVSRLRTWYSWAANESEVRFTLYRAGDPVVNGVLNRGGCDPYQGSWCYAETPLMTPLSEGSYELVTDGVGICANGGSGGLGFYSLYGARRSTGPWREVRSAVVGSPGTIGGEGILLEVPEGAFESPTEVKLSVGTLPVQPGRGASTSFYKVEGLPETISGGLSVVIDAPDAVDGPAHLMVKALEEEDRGPMVIIGKALGGKIYATLPSRSPAMVPAGVKAGARDATLTGSSKWTWMIWAVLGLKANTSNSGRFIIHSPDYEVARKLDPVLERGWDALQAVGLDRWRGSTAIEVYVFSFESFSSQILGGKGSGTGNAETGIWKKDNIGLCINLDPITSNESSAWEEAQRTAAHELLHVLGFAYDSTSQWLWLEEAAATYVERLASTDPKAVPGLIDADRNAAFVIDGPLHIEPGILSYSRTAVQRHGYGAALLLQHLAPVDNLPVKSDPAAPAAEAPKMTGRLFSALAAGKAPLDALEAEFPGLNQSWLEFGGRWMRGSVYKNAGSAVPDGVKLVHHWPSRTMAPDGAFEVAIRGRGEYTGALHEVRFDNANLAAGARLKFTLLGPSGRTRAEIFRRQGNTTKLTPLAVVTSDWTMDDAASLIASRDPLTILLLRGKSTSDVKLLVEKAGSPKYYNPVRLDFGAGATCGDRDCSAYADNLYSQAADIGWDGNRFQVRGERVKASDGCTNSSSFVVSGELGSNRTTVSSVLFSEEAKSVCRDKTVKTNTRLTAGPLSPVRSVVWDDRPGEFSFEGAFPDGVSSFEQSVSITYSSEYRPPENYTSTQATGVRVRLKFPAP